MIALSVLYVLFFYRSVFSAMLFYTLPCTGIRLPFCWSALLLIFFFSVLPTVYFCSFLFVFWSPASKTIFSRQMYMDRTCPVEAAWWRAPYGYTPTTFVDTLTGKGWTHATAEVHLSFFWSASREEGFLYLTQKRVWGQTKVPLYTMDSPMA